MTKKQIKLLMELSEEHASQLLDEEHLKSKRYWRTSQNGRLYTELCGQLAELIIKNDIHPTLNQLKFLYYQNTLGR